VLDADYCYKRRDLAWSICRAVQSGPKKWGHRLMTITRSNLNWFKKFFTGKFLDKFVVKWILRLPPHLACVATLPCETWISANQAIDDKLQDSVATYLRCDGVVNIQIKIGLLFSLWVKKFKSANIWQFYKQGRGCLMHFALLASTRQSRSCL